MKTLRGSLTLLAVLLVTLAFSSVARAQATRTWVSGVGDDANPCSRTAPCKTFAGAISKTAPGGEIDCLDPGGFGALTITKSITLDCTGTFGSVLVAGTNGIVVAAGAGDPVTIRGLHLDGLLGNNNSNAGLSGIVYQSGKILHLEDVTIYGFNVAGITVSGSSFLELAANNVTINDCINGLVASTSSGTAFVKLNNSLINGITGTGSNGNGVQGGQNSTIVIRNSSISYANNNGFVQTAASSSANIQNTQITNSTNGVMSTTGAAVGLYSNIFILNVTAMNSGGGTIFTDSNNLFAGNTSNGVANGGNPPGFKQ